MRRVALITVLLVAAAYSTPSTYNCLWKDPKGNNYDLTPLKSETQDYSAPYDKVNGTCKFQHLISNSACSYYFE